jgi:hemoglobin
MLDNYYSKLGGAENLKILVDEFYDYMDQSPTTKKIRAMHQADLTEARSKLFDFLSGWLGGPPLFVEKYGHPRLRARHLPFPIDIEARDEWMECMRYAFSQISIDPNLERILDEKLFALADFMRNSDV